MSNNPYETSQVAGETLSEGLAATKPASIKVFGILNLVFGIIGICGGVMSALMFFALPQNPQFPNPVLDLMQNNAAYRAFMIISMALGFIFTIVLILGGIGLLKYRRSGRTLSLVYGWYAIASVIVGVVANYVFVVAPMMQQRGADAAAMGGAIGGTVGACFGLIYPVFLLVFMYRRNVVNALD